MRLSGKTALVTGASRGIGRAIAVRFAAEGAFVVVNYAGNEAAAGETLAAIASAGGNAVLSRFDVGDAAEVDAAVKAIVAERGRIDILVNNAGVTRDNLLMRLTEDDFDAVVRTNLKGTFLVTKVVSRQMIRQRGGRIVNMSSVVGEMGNAGQSVYAATKAGILGLHQGDGPGARFPPDHGERDRAGVHHDRHDAIAARGGAQGVRGADPPRAVRGSGGGRRRSRCSWRPTRRRT